MLSNLALFFMIAACFGSVHCAKLSQKTITDQDLFNSTITRFEDKLILLKKRLDDACKQFLEAEIAKEKNQLEPLKTFEKMISNPAETKEKIKAKVGELLESDEFIKERDVVQEEIDKLKKDLPQKKSLWQARIDSTKRPGFGIYFFPIQGNVVIDAAFAWDLVLTPKEQNGQSFIDLLKTDDMFKIFMSHIMNPIMARQSQKLYKKFAEMTPTNDRIKKEEQNALTEEHKSRLKEVGIILS